MLPVWPLGLQAASAGEDRSYGFHGEYADAERGLVDLGQRWYDPRHQVFYSADPAPLDDVLNLVGDPRLTSSYSLNHANSLRFTDPDGRMPRRRGSNSSSDHDRGYDADSEDEDDSFDDVVTPTTSTSTTRTTLTTTTTGAADIPDWLRAAAQGAGEVGVDPPLSLEAWCETCKAHTTATGSSRPWWWMFGDDRWDSIEAMEAAGEWEKLHLGMSTYESMARSVFVAAHAFGMSPVTAMAQLQADPGLAGRLTMMRADRLRLQQAAANQSLGRRTDFFSSGPNSSKE